METRIHPSHEELAFFADRGGYMTSVMWIPHTDQYEDALAIVRDKDIVVDMGCGDLRFSLMLANRCRKVYAIDFNQWVLRKSLAVIGWSLPRNLVVICADWRDFPIPIDATKIICLVNFPIDCLPKAWFANDVKVYCGNQNGFTRVSLASIRRDSRGGSTCGYPSPRRPTIR